MEQLTPQNLPELFSALLEAASDIWGQKVDNVSGIPLLKLSITNYIQA
jgi:hypothetical protein